MKIFQTRSIKVTIIRITMIFTLLLSISISSICFISFESLLKDSLQLSTSSNLQLIMNSFTSNMTDVQTLAKWCSVNYTLAKYISASENYNKKLAIDAWDRLAEEYQNNHAYYYIERIVVSNFHGKYLQTTSRGTTKATNISEFIQNASYFDTLYDAFSFRWIGLVPNDFGDSTNDRIIPIIRPIYDVSSSDKIGWVYIGVNSNIITDALKLYSIPHDSKVYLTIDQTTYLIKDNTFIETTDLDNVISTNQRNATTSIKTVRTNNGKKETLVTYQSNLDGWSLSQTLSDSMFNKQKSIYVILIFFIGGFVMLLGILLLFYLNRNINKPIARILRKMAGVAKGDFRVDPTIEWDNEFGTIGAGINKLSCDISSLIDDKIQDEKERQELEYQMLQSQINPHFLYNTLNSIKWMATIQNATGIAEMTTALSRLMKSVSKDTNQIITIENELDLLNNYFIIQNYRYGGTISLDVTVANEDLYQCQIPKFSLQPMVENAIFHGIEPKGSVGKIVISVFSENNQTITITVEDNGIGLSKDQIDTLLTAADNSSSGFFKKIGVSNVNQRIKYAFGEEYGLRFESKEGEYTKVTIVIPYKR
ncbi:sensor histidine kinase [Anaerosporobacter faecicola]|uniref:sensor histidine kinase n=1 Tax=Anaerosporobacter faecicola TaxID=2718714 RepID=UPI00143B7847|nr:sensor histidine kinase [Anaerosporobacter faecicola]